jgi:hypothetical protein
MDIYRELLKHPEIKAYLVEYPEPLWSRVVSSTLKYGIFSLKALHPVGFSVEMLDDVLDKSKIFFGIEDLLPSLKLRVDNMKEHIKVMSQELDSSPSKQYRTSPDHKRSPPHGRSPGKPRADLRVEPPSFGLTYAEPEWVSHGTQTDKAQRTRKSSKKTVRLEVDEGRTPYKAPPQDVKGPSRHSQSDHDKPSKETYDHARPSKEAYDHARPSKEAYDHAKPSKEAYDHAKPSKEAYDSRSTLKMPQRPSIKAPTPAQKESSRWVGDYTNVIRDNVPPERSYRSESRQSSEVNEDSHYSSPQSEPKDPLMPHWHESSSDSSMSVYHPPEELRHFYKGVYDTLLDSQGRQSGWSSGSSQPQQFGEEPYRTY